MFEKGTKIHLNSISGNVLEEYKTGMYIVQFEDGTRATVPLSAIAPREPDIDNGIDRIQKNAAMYRQLKQTINHIREDLQEIQDIMQDLYTEAASTAEHNEDLRNTFRMAFGHYPYDEN
jgi:CRISPR/Cas system CMR-associated protein Cmr5 small subunit